MYFGQAWSSLHVVLPDQFRCCGTWYVGLQCRGVISNRSETVWPCSPGDSGASLPVCSRAMAGRGRPRYVAVQWQDVVVPRTWPCNGRTWSSSVCGRAIAGRGRPPVCGRAMAGRGRSPVCGAMAGRSRPPYVAVQCRTWSSPVCGRAMAGRGRPRYVAVQWQDVVVPGMWPCNGRTWSSPVTWPCNGRTWSSPVCGRAMAGRGSPRYVAVQWQDVVVPCIWPCNGRMWSFPVCDRAMAIWPGDGRTGRSLYVAVQCPQSLWACRGVAASWCKRSWARLAGHQQGRSCVSAGSGLPLYGRAMSVIGLGLPRRGSPRDASVYLSVGARFAAQWTVSLPVGAWFARSSQTFADSGSGTESDHRFSTYEVFPCGNIFIFATWFGLGSPRSIFVVLLCCA